MFRELRNTTFPWKPLKEVCFPQSKPFRTHPSPYGLEVFVGDRDRAPWKGDVTPGVQISSWEFFSSTFFFF